MSMCIDGAWLLKGQLVCERNCLGRERNLGIDGVQTLHRHKSDGTLDFRADTELEGMFDFKFTLQEHGLLRVQSWPRKIK